MLLYFLSHYYLSFYSRERVQRDKKYKWMIVYIFKSHLHIRKIRDINSFLSISNYQIIVLYIIKPFVRLTKKTHKRTKRGRDVNNK